MVPPFAARWLLVQMRRGPVTGEVWRREALALRQNGRCDLAAQLEMASAQLKLAGRAWDDRDLEGDEPGPVSTSAGGSGGAEAVGPVGVSTAGSEISAKEAAMRLNITRERVGQMIRSGALKGRKVGGSWVVDVVSVESAAVVRGRAS